jgi:hypothetical protein
VHSVTVTEDDIGLPGSWVRSRDIGVHDRLHPCSVPKGIS